MKRSLHVFQGLFFCLFIFMFYLTVVEVFNFKTPLTKYNHGATEYDGIEAYDPTLIRLNTIKKLSLYCDSLYTAKYHLDPVADVSFQRRYAETVNEVIRKKFYHGYSFFGFSDNYMALLLEPLFRNKQLSAIVLPDDIVRFPNAACSQQSIVTIALLKEKGITARPVTFDGGDKYGGHYCFEVFYDQQWHFYDPDAEPDAKFLKQLGRPDIATLASNDSNLLKAYTQLAVGKALALFKNYTHGKPNAQIAPRARFYQRTTQILSYTMWILPFLAFLWVTKRIHSYKLASNNVWNRRIHFSSFR